MSSASKATQPEIQKVLDIYRQCKNVLFLTVQNMVMPLYSPSVLGLNGEGEGGEPLHESVNKYRATRRTPRAMSGP